MMSLARLFCIPKCICTTVSVPQPRRRTRGGPCAPMFDHVARAYLQQSTFARGLGRGGSPSSSVSLHFARRCAGLHTPVQLSCSARRARSNAPQSAKRMGPQQGGVPVVELA